MTRSDDLLTKQYGFRGELLESLVRDLLGPGQPDEVLDEGPLFRYVTGILYPVARAASDEEPDDPEAADGNGQDAGYDPGVALSLTRHPSSMGVSFSIDIRTQNTVRVSVSAARYRVEQPSASLDATSSEAAAQVIGDVTVGVSESQPARRRGTSRPREAWRREECAPDSVTIDAAVPGVVTVDLVEGLELYCVVREARDGRAPVTVVLRNTLLAPARELRDSWCWFQPTLVLTTDVPAFIERRDPRRADLDDDDLASYDLLFRHARSFGVGHGCAVTWEETSSDRIAKLMTTFIPTYELPLATPREASEHTDLRMGFLATADTERIIQSLSALVADYRKWIEARRVEAVDLPAPLQAAAVRHLADAEEAAERIAAGIGLLWEPDVEWAFRLMNRAMRDQRARQDWVRGGATGPVPDGSDQAWRPFQIAFLLLNLAGLVNEDHPDRDQADLLWFPTGGGKTEAYLGLIAFVIFMRRLRDVHDKGVAVIMRYTLRLLTLQQFERAATLICAMENIRRTEPELQDREPITLGLWVGQAATPNKVDDARRGINRLRNGEEPTDGNPMQLTRCPWCGTKLFPENYRIDRAVPGLIIECLMAGCEFERGLPLYVVDEDVYRVRPSLMIGTVDKFAMMAWNEQVRSIFAADGASRPPDLVVQDELHLISGPLGTMVGLYETAVDAAAGRIARPKVVASTATIRRAANQMRAVFDRQAFQFPPPGLEISDSYFSQQASREERGTRQYVGLLAPGTSQTTLLVRTYSALLQEGHDLPASDAVRDPYWTLIGYFNSLRVLGGAFMQVNDDVPDRIQLIASRKNQPARPVLDPVELTSRIPSSKVPEYLDLLAHAYPAPSSPSVVLATNMISVGVDVDRLGLMAVMGQPQATAEYIQATSRVGRKHPGLVVVMYNGARSRDRSHYENFLPYHQSLYREVEATSATPFAARARDRGLHGVLIAMARLLVDQAAADEAAQDVAAFETQLARLSRMIVDRVRSVDPEESEDTAKQLRELIDVWVTEAADRAPIRYNWWNEPQSSLLVEAGRVLTDDHLNPGTDEIPWPTLMSLRDVDAESGLYLIPNRERSRK